MQSCDGKIAEYLSHMGVVEGLNNLRIDDNPLAYDKIGNQLAHVFPL